MYSHGQIVAAVDKVAVLVERAQTLLGRSEGRAFL